MVPDYSFNKEHASDDGSLWNPRSTVNDSTVAIRFVESSEDAEFPLNRCEQNESKEPDYDAGIYNSSLLSLSTASLEAISGSQVNLNSILTESANTNDSPCFDSDDDGVEEIIWINSLDFEDEDEAPVNLYVPEETACNKTSHTSTDRSICVDGRVKDSELAFKGMYC